MHVVDDLAVAVAILASVIYALLALGPRVLRVRLLAGSGALLLRLPRFAGFHGLGQRLSAAARGKAQGACGGCDNCGSSAAGASGATGASGAGTGGAAESARGAGAAAATESARGVGAAAPAEVRIPLSKIGRRKGAVQGAGVAR